MARVKKSPDAFRTISEVARWLETPAHVLRFWESRFKQIAPVKRAGGRRYYRPEDMQLLGGIKHLLHDEGRTIKSVQELMEAEGTGAVSVFSQALPSADATDEDAAATETEKAAADPVPETPVEAVPETAKDPLTEAPQPEAEDEPAIAAEDAAPVPDEAKADEAPPATPAPREPRKPRHGFMLGYPPPDPTPDATVDTPPEQAAASLPPLPDLPADPEDTDLPGALPSVAAMLRGLERGDAVAFGHDAMLSQVASRLDALRTDRR